MPRRSIILTNDGSIYEISGNECCLSTGEFIKIVHVELQKFVCENVDNNSKFDLKLSYPEKFKIISERFLCSSIEEIIKSTELKKQDSELITFQSMNDITTDHAIINKGEPITIISTVLQEGQMYAECVVDGCSEQLHVMLPLKLKGQFKNCEDDQLYTIKDIIKSQTQTRRKVRLAETKGICIPEHFNGRLILSPVYEIQAIMNFRKGIVKIPSTLEIDVRDVTEEQKDITFIKPLSLTDISNQSPELFPIMAEILDAPDQNDPFNSEWFHLLKKGRNLIIYKNMILKKVLATSAHNNISHHFFISENYKGTFRRRPREFPTVFDLCNAFTQEDPLNIVVTKDCTWNEDGVSSLSIGDHLVTMFKTTSEVTIDGKLQNLDVIVCSRVQEDEENDDDEDGGEPLMLPLYLEGRFVEKIHDTKKYKISELYTKFKLPFHVKVTSKDTSLPTDSLTSFPSIKLEKVFEVPTLIASFLDNPSECFSIPIEWVTMNVHVLEEHYEVEDCCYKILNSVEELTSFMYYNLWKGPDSSQCPPPRPPKRANKGTPSPTSALPLLPKSVHASPKSNVTTKTRVLPSSPENLFSTQHRKATLNKHKKSQVKQKKTCTLPEDHEHKQVEEVGKRAFQKTRATNSCSEITQLSDIDSDHEYQQLEEVISEMALHALRGWTL
ncbi:protein THEMIS isoform X2 [Narcine bancroftii]|uniref:protein THEMIS isoform X2 n=1 Tax=Narcine bancroftii TaxID=1343680 RepID=UPI0038311141